MGADETDNVGITNWYWELAYDQWMALPVSGSRPLARYKHAGLVVDDKLFISGGNRNGRHLFDVQVFDLKSLAWSTLMLNREPNAEKSNGNSSQEAALAATSGHNMIQWGNRLFLLGGLSKQFTTHVTVQFVDLETKDCGVVQTSGDVPIAREGQSATLVGSRVIMFGGEDISRRLLNDVYVLDLETMAWNKAETTQTLPAPRYDHTAAVHADRYLLIFGGCSHSTCFNDLHVLDLLTMEWSQPQVQGELVIARAGHSGTVIDGNWYIVGGGDNKSGSRETLMLNMSKLAWSVIASVKEREPLASEGLSVCSTSVNGEKYLVAFGGYNGKYNNEVFVMRPKPRDLSRPKIYQSPAAAAAAASVTAAYALSKSEKLDFTETVGSNFEGVDKGSSQEKFMTDNDLIRSEQLILESSLNEAREENKILRGKLDESNNTYIELTKELSSVQGQLVTERSRCFNLEAQIAELQDMLSSLKSIEDEVQLLRTQKPAWEQNLEVAAATEKQSSGGVWKWIAGGA